MPGDPPQSSACASPETASVPPGPPPPRPWGFWATLGWSAALGVVWVLLQTLLVLALYIPALVWAGMAHQDPDALVARNQGAVILVAFGLASLVTIGLMAGLAHLRRMPMREYFGLVWPRGRQVVVGVALLVLGIAGSDLVLRLAGQPIVSDFDIHLLKSSGPVIFVLATVLVAAPLFEELEFRGFMFKGIAASRAGPVVAIVLTSFAWAVTHVQYDGLRITGIFVMGLFLGAVRWRTGSTPLAILLHSVGNLIILGEILVSIHVYGR